MVSEDEIKLWEVATGKELRTLPSGDLGSSGAQFAAFSPDGRWLAGLGVFHGTIKLWDVATGKELRTLAGHGGLGYSVAFSPDGRWLAAPGSTRTETGDLDSTIVLWDVGTWR